MKSRYLFPLLLLLSCSGTQHLSAQPAPLPPTPTPVVPPAPKPPAPPKPAPKVLPVAKVQMPTLVQPGQLFAITTRGSVGTGRTAIFRPELPAEATVLEMADKRTKDDAFMVTLPKNAKGSYVFVFVVTQAGVSEPAVEAVPFVVGKPTPEPKPDVPDPDVPTPKPDGAFGLSKIAREKLAALPDAAKSLAPKVASNYRMIASKIAAGALSDPQQILDQTKTANVSSLGASRDAWLPWATAIAAKLDEQVSQKRFEGGPTPKDDYRDGWNAIADGLEGK